MTYLKIFTLKINLNFIKVTTFYSNVSQIGWIATKAIRHATKLFPLNMIKNSHWILNF